MKILCVFGEHAYGDPARGEGYEFTNFLPAFRRLGHEVSFFESFSRDPYQSFADLNRHLLEKVDSVKPDVLFCVLMQYEVWLETLRIIRRSGTFLINWSTDDSWKYPMFSGLIGKEFDLFVTTTHEALNWYERDGIDNVFLSQWAANADALFEPIPAGSCRYPVSFIGSSYGTRKSMIDALHQRGISVDCFGYGWPSGPVKASRISEIVRESAVSLNFSEDSRSTKFSEPGRQIKARVFEVPGYGGCLLTEASPHIDEYFQVNEEILVFEGVDDLAKKITFLLAHPSKRDLIAKNAFERVKLEHTYDKRFSAILDAAKEQGCLGSFRPIEWNTFSKLTRSHRQGTVLCVLRKVLVSLMSVIFGRIRGARAARRLVFEISWRLFGAWTYSARGWPGRMFFREI